MRLNDTGLAEVMSKGGRQKTPKFRNKKTGKYDSKKEAKRAQFLKYEEQNMFTQGNELR